MTGERLFVLTPTDTLFFRDGRPYNQQDEGLAHARSLFPPHPSTLTGALRAALALGREWNGHDDWPDALVQVLGDGPDMQGGRVRFGAPLLMRGGEPLYRAPLALVGDGPFALLRPGPPVDCDLGPVRLPVDPGGQRRKAPGDVWLTGAGLQRVLDDRAAALEDGHHIRDEELWRAEPRVGVAIDRATRTVKQGQLYAPVHVRLETDVVLAQPVAGVPDGWTPAGVVPLGGEHRTAQVEVRDGAPAIPRATAFKPARDGSGRCVLLTLLSPARVGADWLKPGRVDSWNAEILSACLGDPIPIGGWDSRKGSRGPRPLRPFLPAGSAWFLRVPAGWAEPQSHLGDDTDARHGFGRFALGTFTDTGADCQGDVP